eukprot:1143358-Pyramimonas_sp.AAC.1
MAEGEVAPGEKSWARHGHAASVPTVSSTVSVSSRSRGALRKATATATAGCDSGHSVWVNSQTQRVNRRRHGSCEPVAVAAVQRPRRRWWSDDVLRQDTA